MSDSSLAQEWQPKRAPLMTRWAKDVSPKNVHPEYPRPQMVRKHWMSLNGLWDLEIRRVEGGKRGRQEGHGAFDGFDPSDSSERSASPRDSEVRWKGKILVPFPVESALSGVMKPVAPADELVYRRSFTVPAKWKGKRILLHFGAVDWSATVFVNGKEVGSHLGGYNAFSFDITDNLRPEASRKGAKAQRGTSGPSEAEQELVVMVRDPTDQGTQPRGKQVLKPEGIWYTPTSGIWQTVWLEPIGETHFKAVYGVPRATWSNVLVFFDIVSAKPEHEVDVEVWDEQRQSHRTTLSLGGHAKPQEQMTAVAMPMLPSVVYWSPDRPHLYGMRIRVRDRGGTVLDEVDSYFAIRSIWIGKDDRARSRIFLNGKPYFLIGLLDQGFWPDGLYTPPSDAALKYDLEVTKKLGFNFIRKHVKVEPDRFYYWCDMMGILVFQDMPSGDKYIGGRDPDITRTKESGEQFERELTAMIRNLRNHPCIVGWVPYNEGWGQWDTARITDLIKKLDPTRLVVSASGWTDRGTGDLIDWHAYPGPAAPKPEAKRASFLGEFGGLGLPIEGHTWQKEGWGYRTYKTHESYRAALDTLFQNLRFLIDEPGLSGAVYTQTTDVETELNGLMTYDRAVIKPDVERLAKVVKALFLPPPKVAAIVPTSEAIGQEWAYTTDRIDPSDLSWTRRDFDDSGWEKGPGGFGTQGTPGALVRTVWTTPEIWLRRTVEIPTPQSAVRNSNWRSPHLRIHHDEDVEVYLDGDLILRRAGYTTGYILVPIDASLLKPGKRLLAVRCKQTGGGQYIDVGIVDVIESPSGSPSRPPARKASPKSSSRSAPEGSEARLRKARRARGGTD